MSKVYVGQQVRIVGGRIRYIVADVLDRGRFPAHVTLRRADGKDVDSKGVVHTTTTGANWLSPA